MKTRITASLIHIALSLVIASIALFAIFFIWYPSPLYTALGVTGIFFILLGVDVCLGPLLTFIVFNPAKKYLWLDLCIIGIFQLAALGYGVYAIFQERPVYVVFSKDRFETINTTSIDQASQKIALAQHNELANISWFGPKWVAATVEENSKKAHDIMLSSVLDGGPDWPNLPELYAPLSTVKAQLLHKSKTLTVLKKLHKNTETINKQLQPYHEENVKWLPLLSKAKNMVVLIDAKTADIIETVDIDPWP